ncbi:MAG: TraR/DksA C4-type zinc finger protein [Allgaiera sp.]|jgi:DnaK suppressor protein|nr:TraR/DksA C4-type zinc finger protein [Allgaiera sp.]
MDDPTPEELRSRFLHRLCEERTLLEAASAQTRRDREPVELDQQSVGRLSRMDAMQQQAMASAQENRRRGRLQAVTAAIRRIENDDFGWCDQCGDFIGLQRLDLDPTVMRCRACAK